MAGFGSKQKIQQVAVHHFFIEFKYRLPESAEIVSADADDVEEVIKTSMLALPVLRNVELETWWLMSLLQAFLSSERAAELGINQAFIFQYDAKRKAVKSLIFRMQLEDFSDEEADILALPSDKEAKIWKSLLNKQFQILYSFPLDDWFEAQKVTF